MDRCFAFECVERGVSIKLSRLLAFCVGYGFWFGFDLDLVIIYAVVLKFAALACVCKFARIWIEAIPVRFLFY
jgi:hypothetical protein